MAARRISYLVALIAPVLATFWVCAMYTLNHFHEWPYLLDSAFYSAIVHRQGFFPQNPPMGLAPAGVTSYWGAHVSVLVSVASVASYAYPGDRVDWYALFQGAIYAPLGAVTAMVLGREQVTRSWGVALLTVLVSIAFALNGQTLSCLGYPHYEIFIPAAVCLMLVGLATGRTRLAWIGMALSAATREDGGFHAALFLGAVFASDLLGAPFPVSRKQIVRMAVVAFAASCVAFFVQKTFFFSVSLFTHEYPGEPAYAHISWATIVFRTQRLFESARFVVYPFFATVLVAAIRRDPRYLLGYAAGIPWFVLNFLAAQDLKSAFSIYTGFPFVTSIFWIAAYGAVAKRRPTPASNLAALGVVSLVATLGVQLSFSHTLPMVYEYSKPPTTSHRALVAVARPLRANPRALGNIWVDTPVGAWTVESMPAKAVFVADQPPPDFNDRDGVMFFVPRGGLHQPLDLLAASPYERCGRAPETPVHFCTRADRELPAPFVPVSPWLSSLTMRPAARAEGGRIVVAMSKEAEVALFGPYVNLRAGAYRAAWRVVLHECAPGIAPPHVDVAVDRLEVTRADITASGEVTTDFEVAQSNEPHWYEMRVWAGACAFDVFDLTVRPRSRL
jgi:hypothetical protein